MTDRKLEREKWKIDRKRTKYADREAERDRERKVMNRMYDIH